MKTKDIISVVNAGILEATGHSLPEGEYYKFFHFKRELRRVYEDFAEAESSLIKDLSNSPEEMKQAGDKVVFCPLRKDGSPDVERVTKFRTAVNSLMEETVTLKLPDEKIPLRYYKELYDENHKEVNGRKVDILATPAVEDFVVENLFAE